MSPSTAPRAKPRAAYIDWTRGIAVLLMIEAHTVDAWTRASSRSSSAYAYAVMAAGFAAPLFLWLAGLAVPLAAAASVRRGTSRREAVDRVCRRGLEIFILAFLFRLQAFILSPGAHPVTLFRVDILNILGPAIAATGLVWFFASSRTTLVLAYSALATGVAMVTPLIRTAGFVSMLPTWLQWYLRPAADNTTFTAFPWVGFAFAGAAVGVLIAGVRDPRVQRRLVGGIGIAGGALIVFGFFAASLPSIYRDASFWTTSPTYFAIRAGVMMLTLAVLYAIDRMTASDSVATVLARLGRSSLFVYWIHVELVYGYASWPIHRRLPLWGTAAAYALFATAIYGAVLLRDSVADAWRRRKAQITFQYKAEAV